MKLFNQAYPARVLEAIFGAIADKEEYRRVKDIQRTVHFKGHRYEISLSSGRDVIHVRWYVNHLERKKLEEKMRTWKQGEVNLDQVASRNVPEGHPLFETLKAEKDKAIAKLGQLRDNMFEAQIWLNKETNVIYEQRQIKDLIGFYLTCETAFYDPGEEDADLHISTNQNGQGQGNHPPDLIEPEQPRRTGGRPKGSKDKTPRAKRLAKVV